MQQEVWILAAQRALARFGIVTSDLQFVHRSENMTFKVIGADDGRPLALRLHRPLYNDVAALRSEHIWICALAKAGVEAPEPVLSRNGEAFVQVDIPALGERRWASVVRWVDGELLGRVVDRETDVGSNVRHFERLGKILGAMHNQASNWTPPLDFTRRALDEDGLMGAAPHWGKFWDHPMLAADDRALLLAVRDVIYGALVRYGKSPGRYSLIHADLHPSNVVVADGHATVIDFDDSAFGWHLYDLAAAIHSYWKHPHFEAFTAACIAGYRTVRPLADHDLALLPMFSLVRAMALIGWYNDRPELPTSASVGPLKDHVCRLAARFETPC